VGGGGGERDVGYDICDGMKWGGEEWWSTAVNFRSVPYVTTYIYISGGGRGGEILVLLFLYVTSFSFIFSFTLVSFFLSPPYAPLDPPPPGYPLPTRF